MCIFVGETMFANSNSQETVRFYFTWINQSHIDFWEYSDDSVDLTKCKSFKWELGTHCTYGWHQQKQKAITTNQLCAIIIYSVNECVALITHIRILFARLMVDALFPLCEWVYWDWNWWYFQSVYIYLLFIYSFECIVGYSSVYNCQ